MNSINNLSVTCISAEGLSQVCHRSVQSYSRPIWPKTEVCKSADCLWQTCHENDCLFDCALPFILFAASLLQTFRDFWWLCNKDLSELLMIMSALDLQQTLCRQPIQFCIKARGNLNFCIYIMFIMSEFSVQAAHPAAHTHTQWAILLAYKQQSRSVLQQQCWHIVDDEFSQ